MEIQVDETHYISGSRDVMYRISDFKKDTHIYLYVYVCLHIYIYPYTVTYIIFNANSSIFQNPSH